MHSFLDRLNSMGDQKILRMRRDREREEERKNEKESEVQSF